ncbi:MAG: GNAT family N-acetyltransferase [Pseudomonadota bacterium]
MSEKEIKPLQCKALPCVMQDKLGFDINIRAYQDKDYQGIITMYDHFEPKAIAMGLPSPDKEVRKQWVDDIINTFFNIIALYQKNIIGHAAVDIFRTKVSPEYMIFLHQDFRSRGIGTKLTLIVKEICAELGCRQEWLTVASHNTRAINVFKRVGFKFRGPIGSEREMVLDLRPKRKKKK